MRRRNLYGRRHGKRLRPGQRRLLDELLPRLAIPGVDPAANPGRIPLDRAALFGDMPVWLEIGFGGGEHLAGQAAAHPDIGFVGCEPFVNGVAKALGDPIRLQLVDVLRKHAGKVCVCELVPLFDISQPTLSHHLKKLREAGIVDSERRGLWAYYYVNPEALEELSAWLS